MTSKTVFTKSIGLYMLLAGAVVLANQAPTIPGDFQAVALSSSQIRLMWDASTDDRRVKSYQIKRDGVFIANTRKTKFTDSNLDPYRSYAYELNANDGTLLSATAYYTVSTLESSPDTDVDVAKPGRGGGKNKPGEEPPTEEPPTEEPPTEEPPVEEPSATGAPEGWRLTFDDDFDGSGDLNIGSSESNWRFETMHDGLHRAGNTGIDALGNSVETWDSVRGKRWSAWYDQYNSINAYRENGDLVMGGYLSGEADPTRPIDYLDNGVLTQYGSSKLYTGWIDTFSRKWVGPGGEHVMDPESPGRLFKYGYVETRINFSEMTTPGFRLSMWLMPGSTDALGQNLVVDTAYDGDGSNGVEIDLFEYEWISEEHENRIHLALLGGAAGSSATSVNTSDIGVQLREGYHTIGFLWTAEKLVWTIDGHVVKELLDTHLIPDVYSYLIVSREMNSGVKNPNVDSVDATDVMEQWPYIPRDPGLYAKNIWEYRDRINTDRALIDYIRVWQP